MSRKRNNMNLQENIYRIKEVMEQTSLELEDEQRREVLEQAQLIYSSKEEVWLILKDEPTETPWPYNLEAVV